MGVEEKKILEHIYKTRARVVESIDDNRDKFSRSYLRGFRDGLDFVIESIRGGTEDESADDS